MSINLFYYSTANVGPLNFEYINIMMVAINIWHLDSNDVIVRESQYKSINQKQGCKSS